MATDTTGKISGKPVVFTQLIANGKKPATVTVPMSSSGLRNLVGFTPPTIQNGKAVWNLDLNGSTKERTVSDFPKASLPLSVSASYELNGHPMTPSDILGKSGFLKVTYTIKNITNKSTTVTFKNVFGQSETVTTKTPVPVAAALSVTFPSSFTNLVLPKASTYGLGDATTSASWTLFTFKPLGGLTQSATYEAQVTNASIPSATLEAEVIPPQSISSLPTISEPGAPTVPTLTVGVHLQSIESSLNQKLNKVAAAASNLLNEFKAVAVPAADQVSNGAATTASDLAALSSDATQLSVSVGGVAARIAQHAADLAQIESLVAAAQADVAQWPTTLCNALSTTSIPVTSQCPTIVSVLPPILELDFRLKVIDALILTLASNLNATQAAVMNLQNQLATTVANDLTKASTDANTFSQQALALANSISLATANPGKQVSTTQTQTIAGGANLDAAVNQLDAAITQAGSAVDTNYAGLSALDVRATKTQLPAGNATGATVQAGIIIYSIAGANTTGRAIHLASIIGITALLLGATLGLAFYRLRKGWPSSMAPKPKGGGT